MIRARVAVAAVLGLLLSSVLIVACRQADRAVTSPSASTRTAAPRASGSTSADPGSVSLRAPTAREARLLGTPDRYRRVAELLAAHGVRVWWESDLVARWLEGPRSFAAAVRRLGVLSRTPGTAGFKIADEIGYYDGLDSPAQALRFLRDARLALHRVAPGRPVLVDAVVLELGCLPRTADNDACASRARRTAPAATIDAITTYLRAGLIDRLDLSTGLGEPGVYPDKDLAAAQDVAWTYVAAGAWPRLTRLQSRKALAGPSGYSGSAARDLQVFVDVPRRHGAGATDIWTWRQRYRDQTVSLFGSSPTTNPLWRALAAEHDRGVSLFTHMTPSALPTAPTALAGECRLAARLFSDVFVAAGTG